MRELNIKLCCWLFRGDLPWGIEHDQNSVLVLGVLGKVGSAQVFYVQRAINVRPLLLWSGRGRRLTYTNQLILKIRIRIHDLCLLAPWVVAGATKYLQMVTADLSWNWRNPFWFFLRHSFLSPYWGSENTWVLGTLWHHRRSRQSCQWCSRQRQTRP